MKTIFLNNHPHPVHGAWAESINAEFILDRVMKFKIPGISRIVKSLSTLMKIPKDTDIVLCESSSQLIAGSLWKSLNKNKKLALIVSDPKVYYFKKMKGLKRKINLWMLNKTDLLIPTSPLMKSLIPKEIKAVKKVVFPYVDVERYNGYTCSKERILIFTGRISYEKGADKTLGAFKLIKNNVKEAKLYMLGFGKLQEKLESEQVQDVIFTGWTDKPEDYLKKGSIYISLARIEPAGIAILEAMLLGLVPVISQGVGNKYIVEKINKELVINNEQEAANLIEKLWNNKILLKKYSEKAKKIAIGYDKNKSLENFKKAISLVGIREFKKINKEKYKPSIKPFNS